jgi:hypothetical protein
MGTIHVECSGSVAAPPATVYRYVADFHQHHHRFLPPAFSDWTVEQGGTGAGTVVRFTLTAGGRSRVYRMRVEEPEPGRELTESDLDSSLVTSFVVDPLGSGSQVTIATRWAGAAGIGGFFERRFAPGALRRIYREELVRLDTYARQQAIGS